ncbi:GNAT family N-acetyltransferase [Congregibacter brevis]|uniref:GNAT family N-acetyltransferase n=1 Tax=Congregibacter brevis TaxID=3081201 RepID=A0ABZ0ICX6_9GAMM|nr:GNAT family N-acetyltransferase [Congregibacter sp. IMCC45268]
MTANIREATLGDIDAILAIDGAYSPVFNLAENYIRLLGSSGLLVVATREDILCGFAACSRVLDEATLLNLVVEPSSQGLGVARLLLKTTTDRLVHGGVTRLMLEVRASNEPAQSLYRSIGFTKDGLREHYYRGLNGARSEAAVLMSRQLENPNAGT